VVALAASGAAHAQIVGPGSANGASGVLGGVSASADARTGAAVASIPFQLFKARGGAQAGLGLVYNSAAGNREAGLGWGLAGIDVIERRGAHGGPPRFDTTDEFTLNGAPLVFASAGYYRLQNGGAHLRVLLSGSVWRVESTDGTVTDLGPADSASGTHVRWVTTRRYDSTGSSTVTPRNFVEYRWQARGRRGLKVLTDIYATGPNVAGVLSPEDFATKAAHHVRLVWEEPSLKSPRYSAPWFGGPDVRLARVDVASMPWVSGSEREVVRRYRLRYLEPGDAPLPIHSFLAEVTMEGRCPTPAKEAPFSGDPAGQWEAPATPCGGPQLVVAAMEYSSLPYPTAPKSQARGAVLPLSCDGTPNCNLYGNGYDGIFADVNHDGLPDLVRGGPAGSHRVFLNPGFATGGPEFRYRPINSAAVVEGTTIRLLSSTNTSVLGWWGGANGPGAVWLKNTADWGKAQLVHDGAQWKWSTTGVFGSPAAPPARLSIELAADFDGDGVIDGVHHETAPTASSPDHEIVWSKRTSALDVAPFNKAVLPATPKVMVPKVGPAFNTTADLNGDGIPDLVRLDGDPSTGNRNFIVYPGKGDGTFGCSHAVEEGTYGASYFSSHGTVACSPYALDGAFYLTPLGLPAYPWTPTSSDAYTWGNGFFFADVTGDGLADFIQLDRYLGLRIARNVDGRLFELLCLNSEGCAGYVDNQFSSFGDTGSGAAAFIDLRGEGVTEIAVASGPNIRSFGLRSYDPNTQARVGLLTSMRTGLGVKTDFKYYASLRAAQGLSQLQEGHPWRTYAETTAQPVYTVETSTMASNPFANSFTRKSISTFRYHDPAYDVQERRLVGFGKVTHVSDDLSWDGVAAETVVDTSYIFTGCQHNIAVADGTAPPVPPFPSNCPTGSENEGKRPLVGLPYLVEVEAGGKKRSTTVYQYGLANNEAGVGRAIASAYATRTDTWLYDPNPSSTSSGGTVSVVVGVGVDNEPVNRVVTLDNPVGRVHLRTRELRNARGSVVDSYDDGRITDADGEIDEQIRVHRDIQSGAGLSGWMELPTRVETTGRPSSLPRVVRYEYWLPGQAGAPPNASGWLKRVTTDVVDSGQLIRDTSGSPLGALPLGTTNNIVVAEYDYDEYGNTVRVRGTPVETPTGTKQPCSTVAYDTEFAELPRSSFAYPSSTATSCAGNPLGGMQAWDRGLQAPTVSTDVNLASSQVVYDGFGRAIESWSTGPDGGALAKRSESAYFLGTDVHKVRSRVYTSPGSFSESWAYLDGAGGALFSVAPGDNGAWIVGGMSRRSMGGRVTTVHRPFEHSGSPDAVSLDWPAETYLGTINEYDSAGALIRSSYGGVPKIERVLHALSVDVWDAMDLSPGADLGNTPTTLIMDGHGRVTEKLRRVAPDSGGPLSQNTIQTLLTYQATGEITKVVQVPPAGMGASITRWMKYDSLGRLTVNAEPNTTHQFSTSSTGWATTKGWRYVYNAAGLLVGTSDARGCGKDIFYDGFGRVTGEDWKPCAGSSPGVAAYSPPNHTTGDGLEVRNTYGESLGTYGRLLMTEDRGARTEAVHDDWGRAVATKRTMAKPGAPIAAMASRYTAHVFESGVTLDDAGRLLQQTTGADVPALMPGGASTLSYQYSARGALEHVDSSYGTLLDGALYDLYGRAYLSQYGDAAHTTDYRVFNAGDGRLSTHLVYNIGNPAWGSSVPGYTAPTPADHTAQTTLVSDSFTYDPLGNPERIDDNLDPADWPTGAKPRHRALAYDVLGRLTSATYEFATADAQISVFHHEAQAGDHHPVPRQTTPTRTTAQSWTYAWNGNVTSATATAGLTFDRALGNVTYGTSTSGPNRIAQASSGPITPSYDKAGNLVDLLVKRNGPCEGGKCIHRFAYEYDEVNQMVRARRWDYGTFPVGEPVYPALPAQTADFDVQYTYGAGGRAIKTVKDAAGVERHTVDVFGTLRLTGATYDAGTNDYERTASTEKVFLSGFGRVVYDGAHALPSPSQADLHVFLAIGDHQGSTSVVMDLETSEVVEKATYLAFGAPDSDFRPERWGAHREDNRYTGKEDDIEVGLTYFGARYYSPYLHSWTQADPLTVQALGSDLNPYAFVNGNPASYTDPTGLDGCMDDLNRGCGGRGGGGGGTVSVSPPSGGSWDDALNGVCRLLGGCGANRRPAGSGGGGSNTPPSPPPPPPPAKTAPGAAGTFIAPAVAHSPLAANMALGAGRALTSDVDTARKLAVQLLENRSLGGMARVAGGYTTGFAVGAAGGAAHMAAGDGVAGFAVSQVFQAALSHVPGAHGNAGFGLGMIQGGRVPGVAAAAAGALLLPAPAAFRGPASGTPAPAIVSPPGPGQIIRGSLEAPIFEGHGTTEPGSFILPEGTFLEMPVVAELDEVVAREAAMRGTLGSGGVIRYPGEAVPNLVLHPPTPGMYVRPTSWPVTQPTMLVDILEPNMGFCVWAACQ
jgi:RHS repeat-associated protein